VPVVFSYPSLCMAYSPHDYIYYKLLSILPHLGRKYNKKVLTYL